MIGDKAPGMDIVRLHSLLLFFCGRLGCFAEGSDFFLVERFAAALLRRAAVPGVPRYIPRDSVDPAVHVTAFP